MVVGVVAGLVLSGAGPVAAEPDPPALGNAERVAGLGTPAPYGYGYSGDGFAATLARLGRTVKIATAADGAVLVADPGNQRLRRVGTDGVIDTVPAPAPVADGGPWFSRQFLPSAVDSGPDGSVYLSDGERVGRLAEDGSWTVVGGGGQGGGDSRRATDVALSDVANLDVDATGAVYLTEGHEVRRIDADGTITTVAGGGTTAPSATPVAATSALLSPHDIAVDPAGGFWLVDYQHVGEDAPELVHVDAKGVLTLVPLEDRFTAPFAIAVGADGTVYLGVGPIVHRLADDGATTPLGGPFAGSITDLAVAADGTVYAATPGVVERLVLPDEREGRKLSPARPAADPWADEEPGAVHRVAGDGRYQDGDDDPPAAPEVAPTMPGNIAAAPEGGAYVLDAGNERILRVSPTGDVDVFATLPRGQSGNLTGLTRGADGALYTLDANFGSVFRIGPDGAVTTTGAVTVDKDHEPGALAIDEAGNVYVPADDGQVLLRAAQGGGTVPVAGGGEREGAEADGGPATQASMYLPRAAAIGPDGSVAVLETYLNAVRLVRPDGTLTTIAGNADAAGTHAGFGGDGGPATAAVLNSPGAVAFAPDGTVYIADTLNNRVRRIGGDGVITTVAGTGERDENGDGGPAVRAALTEPGHLAVADDGAIWVTGAESTRVRRIDRDGTITTPADFAAADADPAAVPAGELAVGGHVLAVDPAGTVYVDDAGRTIQAVSSGRARTAFDTRGEGAPVIATAADGSLYYGGTTVRHRFPDGAETQVLSAARAEEKVADGAGAQSVGLLPRDIAVGPDGTLYAATDDAVYAIVGGRLDQRWRLTDRGEGNNQVTGITVGPDHTLYIALYEHQVIAVGDGKARRFAGTGDNTVVDGDGGDDIGDGGAATDAVLQSPSDVAVTSDGSVFVSTTDGIRRIAPDGDIDTVVAGHRIEADSLTRYAPPRALAVDAHDNLYFTEPSLNQVRVVVRPAALPDQSGTSLWWWLGGGALVLAAAAAFLVWHRRTSAQPAPAGQDAPPPDGADRPASEDIGR